MSLEDEMFSLGWGVIARFIDLYRAYKDNDAGKVKLLGDQLLKEIDGKSKNVELHIKHLQLQANIYYDYKSKIDITRAFDNLLLSKRADYRSESSRFCVQESFLAMFAEIDMERYAPAILSAIEEIMSDMEVAPEASCHNCYLAKKHAALLAIGNHERSVSELTTILQDRPVTEETTTSSMEYKARTLLIEAYLELSESNKALACLEQIVNVPKEEKEQEIFDLDCYRVQVYVQLQRYDEALAIYHRNKRWWDEPWNYLDAVNITSSLIQAAGIDTGLETKRVMKYFRFNRQRGRLLKALKGQKALQVILEHRGGAGALNQCQRELRLIDQMRQDPFKHILEDKRRDLIK